MPLSTGFRKHLRWRSRESTPTLSQHSLPDRRTSVAKRSQRKKKNLIGHPISKMEIGAPRWTLTDSMTNVLTDQRFRGIETDEMLETDPIVMLPETQEAAQQLNEGAMRKPCFIGSVSPVASTESYESIPRGKDKDDISPESLPRLIPKDSVRLSAEHVQRLPPPPDITVTAADRTEIKPLSDVPAFVTANTKSRKDDKCIYLMSTPYTLTQPSFRHGPIVLSKADVGRGIESLDDTLDWEAFQIAIQGGVGDFFQDISKEQDEEEVEEIISWFDTFGFETHGVLVTEDVPELEFEPGPSMRPSSDSTLSSTPSTIDMDNNLPIPVGAEFPSGFWNALEPGQAFEKVEFSKNTGLKRWLCEGGPKRPSFHSSDESLPPSPMMPLMVDDESPLSDRVPMGCNLGHDLGDFLKWQEENIVYV
ncbi:hypothetical protein BFJ63_vAg17741 [Fusarium oxysporum f. sp. narcissi]|uniref:Uncharacterized protein n=1 Tax=Fusarium oxysporum f. sp. narcissi TaxID=451672 RepID=A0A4Q2V3H1_FUSOX|nr:hypothetical protein H9L39_20084 [Fusarium oxysporum f. sp. albedinis]RYC79379.1 hypothetical protein BFJ63_vAg17741 [Fusarium oxysporum f. sp. narcissi]